MLKQLATLLSVASTLLLVWTGLYIVVGGRCCVQSGSVVVIDDERVNASLAPSAVAQSCNRQTTRDYMNPHRQDARRRPDAESYRVYAQPDAVRSGTSVDQLPDVRGFSGPQGGTVAYPYTRTDQPVDHAVGSMRCETCSRPAMFVCSACKKAPYCSVDCQVSCYLLFSPRKDPIYIAATLKDHFYRRTELNPL